MKYRNIILIVITCLFFSAVEAKKPAATKKAREVPSSASVRKEHKQAQADIKQTTSELSANRNEIQTSLTRLDALNSDIADCNASIATLNSQIAGYEKQIKLTADSINRLNDRLASLQSTMAKFLRQARGSRSAISNLSFVFSSSSFEQAFRRLQALKQFSKWRDRKADEIKAVKSELDKRKASLSALQYKAQTALAQVNDKRAKVAKDKAETDRIVASLRDRGSELEALVAEQRRKAKQLESQLQAALEQEAEARRIAEEKRLAEQRRKDEEARRQREAEEQRRLAEQRKAEQQRLAEERRKEEEARLLAQRADADAKAAAQKNESKKPSATKSEPKPAKQSADVAVNTSGGNGVSPRPSSKRSPIRRGSKSNTQSASTQSAEPQQPARSTAAQAASASRDIASAEPISGKSFAQSKGSLPYPVEGSWTILRHFGRNTHPNLPNVVTDNAGIDLLTSKGAAVRSVFDGEVSAIFCPDGYNNVVVVRHGNYVTVYANLGSLSVRKGDRVSRGQKLGTVYVDPYDSNQSILHFEIRNATSVSDNKKENPEQWLRK